MTEDELIAALRDRLGLDDERVRVGIGDDAAVLADGTVVSVDAVVEGVHFDRRWLELRDVGYRGTVAALSDLAAMGAAPTAVVSSVSGPDGAELLEVMLGAAEAAHAHGAVVVGGNVTRAPCLSLHTAVLGRTTSPWTRAGAKVGEAVYVTGPVGGAALGWRSLRAGAPIEPLVRRWRRPRARFDRREDIFPSACIDVSDGLARDLGRLCAASGVGARLEWSLVPTPADFADAAATLDLDPLEIALGGGEDYELVFTMAASLPPEVATRIGEITAAAALEVVGPDGSPIAPAAGWSHFPT